MEQTLVLIKPDAVQRGLIGEIITRLERRGLKIVAMKLIQMDQLLARRHYAIHEGKPFFEGLVRFITSSPVVAMVLEGRGAIEVVRATVGTTDPARAAQGSIRGDLALEIGRNLVHASDSLATAAQEMALFFDEDEIVCYERSTDPWIAEVEPL